MDAYLSNSQNSGNSFDRPPILIVTDSESGKARALSTAMMAGFRIADSLGIDAACKRIGRQGAASALWVELDADSGEAMDRLLDYVAADVSPGRHTAVVAAPALLVDRLAVHAFNLNMDLIIDADESERVAALAVAVSGLLRRQNFSDVTADKNAVRLRQLSDEVSRIAATLARLSTGPAATPRAAEAEPLGDVPEVSVEMLRAIIRARRLRGRYFDEELFADPAWDMLLDLLYAEISNLRVPVSSLCIAAAVPATTALRWLKTMVLQGIFVRQADPHDGRRVFVELAPSSSEALRRYFADVGKVTVV
jgi:DNA-binding MarR family transcriptional regulator